jgi:hypothetical protein
LWCTSVAWPVQQGSEALQTEFLVSEKKTFLSLEYACISFAILSLTGLMGEVGLAMGLTLTVGSEDACFLYQQLLQNLSRPWFFQMNASWPLQSAPLQGFFFCWIKGAFS